MKTKAEILLNLLKNGWKLYTAWDVDSIYLILHIEIRSEYRNERRYTATHKEELNRLLLTEDINYFINLLELTLLNQLYNKMLIEQGTKVL